jgi:hypothetical protein
MSISPEVFSDLSKRHRIRMRNLDSKLQLIDTFRRFEVLSRPAWRDAINEWDAEHDQLVSWWQEIKSEFHSYR